MERNKWEIAIRCLEVALHPRTSDDEIIAGVNGFRRTANGIPLSAVCLEYASQGEERRLPAGSSAKWKEKFDRLHRENLDLRRQRDLAETSRTAAARRLQEAERRIRALGDELAAAHSHAAAAELRLASLRAAAPAPPTPFRHEKFEPARHAAAERQAQGATAPFRTILAAALDRNRETSGAGTVSGTPRTPWTA